MNPPRGDAGNAPLRAPNASAGRVVQPPTGAGTRRRRVAIIADAVAETQERFESATASSLGDVRDALAGQGFEPVVLEFAGEPGSWLSALREGDFDLVFNLCEGLSGHGSEEHLPAAAEDASLGIDAGSVVRDGSELQAARVRAHASWERVIVQRFIDGRELNLAVVGDRVLPPAE